MSTAPATIDHMLDTIPLTLTVKKMFGEYALYLNGIVVAFVCDDTLFIKPTPGAQAVLPDAERGPAYPGSKDYIIGSEALDDPELCARALRAVAADAPPPKPKKPKAAKKPKAT
ncbi:MAG: TfoX/Sxy family protein [Cypionkella sp.]|uniref:TfoX/Sxy family protein n=1 Tax=Cypionkella sp. TaxID=2811411 RepID=UPI002ABC69F6|nr:TfoX/Sxy family protein [Cypionkella sp.]MDZ4312744.1 TfoX/Sxy family protein [Cypionkella sp.]MDZ4395061.1 TfoX/Sxy family protein [Cypionkella sp.]